MPPKAAGGKADKVKAQAKQKAAEDKTFGLKNKNKSAKVQKYVANVKQNATQGIDLFKAVEAKKKAKTETDELGNIFAVAIKQPKVPDGVDPKSVVCEFFRHNQCAKGAKCKYSHDLSVERKGPKISLYADQRDLGKDGEEGKEGMEDWDQATLEAAIRQKHSNENKPTEIICKFFLDAVEKKLYGWFWKCPNGEDCKYRHALPNGYVLKSQMKELLEEEARNAKDITETIEEERARVVARTPVTQETFSAWHKAKQEARAVKRAAEEEERRKKGVLNGREIFMQEGFVAADDASAADDYAREEDEEANIREMMARAQAQAEDARRQAAELGPLIEEDEDAGAGPSGSGAGPSGTHLKLEEGEAEALFGEEEDDDEELDMEDDDDDDDEEELDGLEDHVKGLHSPDKDFSAGGLLGTRSAPLPAHFSGTSPGLLRKRQEQLAAAQDLTRSISACSSLEEAQQLYAAHSNQLNAIHFSALFSSLARLATTGALPPTGAAGSAASRARRQPLSRAQRNAVRRFVSEVLVPHVGLRLLGMGPRQLSTVLAALATLDVPPPPFWLSEWLQHFGRRVEQGLTQTPATMRSAAAGPGPGSAAEASASASPVAKCLPGDLAQAMWALAKLQGSEGLGDDRAAAVAATAGGPHDYWGDPHAFGVDAPTAAASTTPPPAPSAAAAAGSSASSTPAGPSLVWLDSVAQALAKRAHRATPADVAAYLWAAARLGYRPPEATVAALMRRCEELMGPSSGPEDRKLAARELCGVLWALAILGFNPGAAWLRRASAEVARMAGGVTAPVAERAAVEVAAQVAASAVAAAVADASTPAADAGDDWWSEHLAPAAAAAPLRPVVAAVPVAPLRRLTPRQASTCMWALAKLGHRPEPDALGAMLRAACTSTLLRPSTSVGPTLSVAVASVAPQDLSMLAFALALMRFRPDSAQTVTLLAAMAGRLPAASGRDLVVWGSSLARLQLAVPRPWAQSYVAASARQLDGLGAVELVDWVHALSRLQMAVVEEGSGQQPARLALTAEAVGAGADGATRGLESGPAPGLLQRPRRMERQGCESSEPPARPSAASVRRAASASGPSAVVVRPASWTLSHRLLRRLMRATVARLPDLSLEQQCRMAWAAARLHTGRGGPLVDAVVRSSTDALDRRLSQQHLTSPAASSPGARGLGGAPHAAVAKGAARGMGDAVPLVNLVWAVATMLRLQQRTRLHLAVRRQRRFRALADLDPEFAAQSHGANADKAAREEDRDVLGNAPRRLPSPAIRRRWTGLLLLALLPQLPSLDNTQLLRLVHSLAELKPLLPRSQRRLAADLRTYCHGRVAATCGEDDACDLTTAGLLRWSQAWERSSGVRTGRRQGRAPQRRA
ncbi:hypothetical protein HYH03_012170 [Edaphochlamys debaryana]|uniref:C3H1-type domain-containing protein n=1 Tax=Edaphochlamys debaryana TaxID=47281 RepID=A0A836BUE8_9CHLO|nr:hypothetical protein HYH03_012170 [Edaphochlamys debaryana]|eukprot:KAG2489340.1 hypothetical protein HYH03_012170 [Edaphochlamys debaryana]